MTANGFWLFGYQMTCTKWYLYSVQHRRWYRKLSYFYKFYKNESPQYLFKLIPVKNSECSSRSM